MIPEPRYTQDVHFHSAYNTVAKKQKQNRTRATERQNLHLHALPRLKQQRETIQEWGAVYFPIIWTEKKFYCTRFYVRTQAITIIIPQNDLLQRRQLCDGEKKSLVSPVNIAKGIPTVIKKVRPGAILKLKKNCSHSALGHSNNKLVHIKIFFFVQGQL